MKEFQDEKYDVVAINGARVYTKDGWGLVRASSNTPTLVLRFESKTEDGLAEVMDLFRKKLEKFPEVDSNWDTSGH